MSDANTDIQETWEIMGTEPRPAGKCILHLGAGPCVDHLGLAGLGFERPS